MPCSPPGAVPSPSLLPLQLLARQLPLSGRRSHRLLWAYGEWDEKYRELARDLTRGQVGWEHCEIRGSGHACHLERPDLIVDLLKNVLDKQC